jgi:succinyl-diaminopimelate desuccinylase
MKRSESLLKNIEPEELYGLVQGMVRIPRVTGDENELPKFLAGRWRAIGLQAVELHEVVPGRFNVVGMVDSGRPGKTLVFTGHIDTVPEDGRAIHTAARSAMAACTGMGSATRRRALPVRRLRHWH